MSETSASPQVPRDPGAAIQESRSTGMSLRTRVIGILRRSGLCSRLLPASLLNFAGGLLAGAGISLLTTAEIGQTRLPAHDIAIDSAAWLAAAVFASSAAHVAETADRRADLAISRTFSPQLKQDIRRNEAAKSALRFWLLFLAAIACIGLAASRIA